MRYIRKERETVEAVLFRGPQFVVGGQICGAVFDQPLPKWMIDAFEDFDLRRAVWASISTETGALSIGNAGRVETHPPGTMLYRRADGQICGMRESVFRGIYGEAE